MRISLVVGEVRLVASRWKRDCWDVIWRGFSWSCCWERERAFWAFEGRDEDVGLGILTCLSLWSVANAECRRRK